MNDYTLLCNSLNATRVPSIPPLANTNTDLYIGYTYITSYSDDRVDVVSDDSVDVVSDVVMTEIMAST